MGIGISHYYDVYNNTTYYVKECGCYVGKEKDEIDRVWVTYTTYKTYHYLCKNHMSEYRSKKKD